MGFTSETKRLISELQASVSKLVDESAARSANAWLGAFQDIIGVLEDNLELIINKPSSSLGVIRAQLANDAIQGVVGQRVEELAAQLGTDLSGTVRDLIDNTIRYSNQILGSQLPKDFTGIVRVNSEIIEAMIARTTSRGGLKYSGLSDEVSGRIGRVLNSAAARGEGPNTVKKAILREIQDEFGVGQVRAATIARTELLDANRLAALRNREANSDFISGWIWQASLSNRTCRSCWEMHGTSHPVSEPGPDDHPNGRCIAVDRVKSWDELGLPDSDFETGLDDYPSQEEARTVFDGLSKSDKEKILGKQGYQEYLGGNYGYGSWSKEIPADNWRRYYTVTTPPKTTA